MQSKRGLFSILILGAIFALILFAFIKAMNSSKSNIASVNLAKPGLPESYKNSAWVWDSPIDISEDRYSEMIRFARESNISVIYLFVEEYISISENSKLNSAEKVERISELESKLDFLIKLANESGIEVEALAGGVDWAESSHEYIPFQVVDHVREFNANHEAQFSGIHFDIEFYNRKGFEKEKHSSTIRFLNMVNLLTLEVSESFEDDFTLGFAVPFWLDQEDGVVPKISYKGKNDIVLAHLLEILKDNSTYLVLMAYRNEAKGTNGTIEISKDDIALAEAYGVKMFVGQETKENELEKITFFGQKKSSLHAQASHIAEAFGSSSIFSGIAVHTLEGYMDLK